MKKLLVILIFLACNATGQVLTTAQLIDNINSNVMTNGQSQITALNLRNAMIPLANAIGAVSSNSANGTWNVVNTNSPSFSTTDPISHRGRVHIGNVANTNSNVQLAVAGTIEMVAATTPSDSRLKTNVKLYQRGLQELLKIAPVSFSYRDTTQYSSQTFRGVIAQNVEQNAPELIKEMVNGMLSVEKENLVLLCINAIKEQQENINSLKAKIENLSKIVNSKKTSK